MVRFIELYKAENGHKSNYLGERNEVQFLAYSMPTFSTVEKTNIEHANIFPQ